MSPKPVEFHAEVRSWSFNLNHNIFGFVYADKRELSCMDGDPILITQVRSITEFPDCFLVRTYAYNYKLDKDYEQSYQHDQNVISLEHWKKGGAK